MKIPMKFENPAEKGLHYEQTISGMVERYIEKIREIENLAQRGGEVGGEDIDMTMGEEALRQLDEMHQAIKERLVGGDQERQQGNLPLH